MRKPIKPAERTRKAVEIAHIACDVQAALSNLSCSAEQREVVEAIVGTKGYSRRPTIVDTRLLEDAVPHLCAALAAELKDGMRHLVRAEFFLAAGLSSISAATIFWKAVADGAAKPLTDLKHDAVIVLGTRLLKMPQIAGAPVNLLTSAKAAILVPNEVDVSVLAMQRERRWTSPKGGLPRDTYQSVELSELEATVRWMVGLDGPVTYLKSDKQGNPKLHYAKKGVSAEAMLRLIEVGSQIALPGAFIGTGRCVNLMRQIRSKLLSSQRARVETGKVLPSDFDIAEFWHALWIGLRPGEFRPVRFDFPLRAPLSQIARRRRLGGPLKPRRASHNARRFPGRRPTKRTTKIVRD